MVAAEVVKAVRAGTTTSVCSADEIERQGMDAYVTQAWGHCTGEQERGVSEEDKRLRNIVVYAARKAWTAVPATRFFSCSLKHVLLL